MKKIALIAPSSPAPDLTPETIEIIRKKFLKIGYQIRIESHALDENRYLAGSDEDRAGDVMKAFEDKEIDAVMTVRGGYGSPRILDLLNYRKLKQNQKPFWTLSDGTALETALYTKAGITGYSGLQALFLLNPKNEKLIKTAFAAFKGKLPPIPLKKIWVKGKAKGVTIGGNLSVFEALLGTPYFPDMKDKILIIEDVNEEPYKVDRMLAHLKLAGVFKKVKGIVLGDFSSCIAKDPKDGTIEEVFEDYFKDFKGPVVQINYGHRNRETVVPIGKLVQIDTTKKVLKEVK